MVTAVLVLPTALAVIVPVACLYGPVPPVTLTHVQRILAKLGLRDRIQAVIFAYEAGVIQIGSHDR